MASNLSRVAAVVFCLFASLCQAQELYRPLDRAATRYLQMFVDNRFAELEQESNDARLNGALLEDGQPRLWAIYQGIGDDCNCYQRATAQFEAVETSLGAWRKQYPKSITAEVLTGEVAVARAWAIRGGGYANTVTPEGWEGFHAGLEAAEKSFLRMSPQARTDPHWYIGMLVIGLGQGWPEKRYHDFYLEAVRRHPRYYPIFRQAGDYYTPRWHGSPEQTRQFIQEAATLTTADNSDNVYTRLSWAYFADTRFPAGSDWNRMKPAFETMAAKFPDPWVINNFAKLACKAGDYQTASKLEGKIRGHLIPTAWSGSVTAYDECLAQGRSTALRRGN